MPAHRLQAQEIRPTYLRCEARVNPLGVDEPNPQLSWELLANVRSQRQTAYRILVASSPSLLKPKEADLWDSGKVDSEATSGIAYSGVKLSSNMHCYWKVQVWGKELRPSSWSDIAEWSMGLLNPTDWKGDWIGYDKHRKVEMPEARLEGAKWIGPANDPPLNAPKGRRLLHTMYAIPATNEIDRAELLATGDDNFRLAINGELVMVGSPGGYTNIQQANVTHLLKRGINEFRVELENASAGPAGFLSKLIVVSKQGKTNEFNTDDQWYSLENPGTNWISRAFEEGFGKKVAVLGEYGMAPWGKLKSSVPVLPPVPYLRVGFQIRKPVAKASFYASALGIYDAFINGKQVGEDYFNPGWTDYTRRVYYRTYNVTAMLQQGENVIGAMLADGWFSGYLGFMRSRDSYGKLPRFRAQLILQYRDGSQEIVSTGPQWKAMVGAVREADFLMGETYDARRELSGWNLPGFSDDNWDSVVVGSPEVKPVLQAHPGPPVRVLEQINPVSVSEVMPGTWIFDLGQNFAGIPRISLNEGAGQQIILRYGERLNPDGTLYTLNLRDARARDMYICKGNGSETWQPRFTFHGFQYIEVTGLKKKPSRDFLMGLALSSDTPRSGSFSCSNPMLNQLHKNIYYTQRANFIDIPTDCPQRDERLGWTGDAQVYIRTATLNTDVQAFFKKWLVDLADGQRADGQFPMVAPAKCAGDDGGPAWADAGVICPWTVYETYGDRRILERQYESMRRFVDFCEGRCASDLLPPSNFHCFGDWLNIEADTPKEVIFVAYFAYATKIMAQAAHVLGKSDDVEKYTALFKKIKNVFNRIYIQPDGRIRGDTQTAYVLALAFDLVEGDAAMRAANHLISNIESRDWHLSTGFIGTKDLMLVLSKIGCKDIAYRLLLNDTFPSWGFSIKQGATSIWERWDGWTPEKGFQDPGMNSFAHYSFGAVYQWMVENIGGIRLEEPGYKKFIIAPQFSKNLNAAKTSYHSIHGVIETDWQKGKDELKLRVRVPVNTTARIVIPVASADLITESGKRLARAEGVSFMRMDRENVELVAGSGEYSFTINARIK